MTNWLMGHFSRPFYIGVCVICIHAAVLWVLAINVHRTETVTPILLVQMPPAQLAAALQTLRPTQAISTTNPKIEQVIRTEKRMTAASNTSTLVNAEPPPQPPTDEASAKTASSTPGPALAAPPSPGATTIATNRKDPTVNPAQQTIQLPTSHADYLNNPQPNYPAISQRLGEHGIVVIRVLIGKDGSALQAEVNKSSGFERLDQSALKSVMGWRYVPGKRAGIAQDMWFDVPINYD